MYQGILNGYSASWKRFEQTLMSGYSFEYFN